MSKHKATVSMYVEIEIDDAKFDEAFMAEFREGFYPFYTVQDHLQHIAQLEARGLLEDFTEGYGPIKDMGIEARDSRLGCRGAAMTQYRAETTMTFSGWDSGYEHDLKMVVTFKVNPGSPATHIDPPEYPSVEVDAVRFFELKRGDTAAIERPMPGWLVDRMTQDEGFTDWLMSEASEQAEQDRDEAADARRDELREMGL